MGEYVAHRFLIEALLKLDSVDLCGLIESIYLAF